MVIARCAGWMHLSVSPCSSVPLLESAAKGVGIKTHIHVWIAKVNGGVPSTGVDATSPCHLGGNVRCSKV